MAIEAREILLVGSVPLRPAAAVFETVAAHLGSLAPRIPDSEQIGWLTAARRSFLAHPMLEVAKTVPLNALGADPVEILRLKPGVAVQDLRLGPYGYAANAIASYAEFKRLKSAGKIPAATRHQVTLPGPGTTVFSIALPAEEILPIARAALLSEIEEIVRAIPAGELTIQLDIGMEAEHEEYLRRPEAFDQPIHQAFHWTLDQMADSVAWLANRIPIEVERGFRICSIWHHDPKAGQDNDVLVDTANAIAWRVERPVGYVHIPVIPEHEAADFAAFARLELKPGQRLYLGLINLADGIEGATRRIAMAEKSVPDFGVGYFCGLGRPPTAIAVGPTMHSHPPIPALRRASQDTIRDVLDLHRAVAEA